MSALAVDFDFDLDIEVDVDGEGFVPVALVPEEPHRFTDSVMTRIVAGQTSFPCNEGCDFCRDD